MEVQSKMNWVRMAGVCVLRTLHDGWTEPTVFISLGRILLLVSARAGQIVRMCSIVSYCAWHSLQDGSVPGRSLDLLQPERKSPVKNFKWSLSLFASCVVWMLRRLGCGRPQRPFSWTFKYSNFEFGSACLFKSASNHAVTLVLTRHFHWSSDHAGLLSRSCRGLGREYFLHRICAWLLYVRDVSGHIFRIYFAASYILFHVYWLNVCLIYIAIYTCPWVGGH